MRVDPWHEQGELLSFRLLSTKTFLVIVNGDILYSINIFFVNSLVLHLHSIPERVIDMTYGALDCSNWSLVSKSNFSRQNISNSDQGREEISHHTKGHIAANEDSKKEKYGGREAPRRLHCNCCGLQLRSIAAPVT